MPAARLVLLATTLGTLGACTREEPPPVAGDHYASADTCATCHPLQSTEWRGSVMHYAALSPVFNAFELTARELSGGKLAADGELPSFCSRCHTPLGFAQGELPAHDPVAPKPVRDHLSPLAAEGITCDFCHTLRGPDREASLDGDGIANLALDFAPGATKVGPLWDPAHSPYHQAAAVPFLKSSEMCGGCHDVRLPVPDLLSNRPVQRVEDLFTEWAQSPYARRNNPYRRVISCQDCHMSLFPLTEPGVYPRTQVATGGPDDRPHALHAFTAVSIPLLDDPRFPNVESAERDAFGFPRGQAERRQQMLRAACTLSLEATSSTLAAGAAALLVRVVVTNTGAGHNVPAGFSQERQVWIELEVRDAQGVIYRSGYLTDRPHGETGEPEPDGRLHDEDLEDAERRVSPADLSVEKQPGPDADQRPARQLGLVNFQNRFLRRGPGGDFEEIVNPLAAEAVDNTRSLPPLVPVEVRYQIPRPPRGWMGSVEISARLRFRSFPPYLLRALAVRHPSIVGEGTLDRNTIVDMAEATRTVELR